VSGISSAVPPIKFDSAGNVLANINAQNINPNANAVNIKTDANGNVLANINAQNINPNANAVNVKTDANGNVLANINAQSITPNAVASNIKTDANGNVLANINAQNINPNANAVNIKTDANGNVLANINAQNITPTATASNIKTDASGNVLANINAQSITPNAVATNVKTDANGNVLANINAQNINPNVANPYAPQLLSHQTGLSASISTANAYVNTGSSITVPRTGIVKIILIGYPSTGNGYWRLTLTRGGVTYFVQDQGGNPSWNSSLSTSNTFIAQNALTGYFVIELACLSGDVLQLQVTDSSAGAIIYTTDMVVILQ